MQKQIRRSLFFMLVLSVVILRHNAQAADLKDSMAISASGMRAQSDRLRIVSQNIANAESTSTVPGGDPYRRKTIYFKNKKDPETGLETVKVYKYGEDKSPYLLRYEPGHPAANAEGYVKYPNVDTVIESQDAKEAQRSYEANLNMLDVSRSMVARTLDILR